MDPEGLQSKDPDGAGEGGDDDDDDSGDDMLVTQAEINLNCPITRYVMKKNPPPTR